MRVRVDQEKCCASGLCAVTAPGVFDQREDDGIVVLLNPRPSAHEEHDVEAAAMGCPCEAIIIEEAGEAEKAAL